jgi:hypothetical protein
MSTGMSTGTPSGSEMSLLASASPQEPVAPILRMSEAALLQAFATVDDPRIGLLAYGLHRQDYIQWLTFFTSHHASPPTSADMDGYLTGEIRPTRIEAYHAQATSMLRATPILSSKKTPQDAPKQIAWRHLVFKLGALMIAVVVTALLLRQFVVNP